jgi:hypothetical protein
MKTKIIFLESDMEHKKHPHWNINDEGYIDGYVCDHYCETFACVVTNYKIVKVPLRVLKVIGQL